MFLHGPKKGRDRRREHPNFSLLHRLFYGDGNGSRGLMPRQTAPQAERELKASGNPLPI